MEKLKSKCYFCNEETNGKQFYIENSDTKELNIKDVCENCCSYDLDLVTK